MHVFWHVLYCSRHHIISSLGFFGVDLLNGCRMLLEVNGVRSHDKGARYGRGRAGSLYKNDILKYNYKNLEQFDVLNDGLCYRDM
jgi:hypothetical protein